MFSMNFAAKSHLLSQSRMTSMKACQALLMQRGLPILRMSTSENNDPQKRKGPVITKQQMKNEMLEHDYFDTEILYHGMTNPRTDDHKRSEKDLLDEQ